MAEGGVVAEIVIAVLKAGEVGVSQSTHNGMTATTMVKGDVVEVQYFPAVVRRHLVDHLAKKFGVPVTHFWHPEMLAGLDAPGLIKPN